jgi:hypothetical protein
LRIGFLTSALEPGRDGVGDYTRQLAEECSRRGHGACLLALNDRQVTSGTGESPLPATLRLSSSLGWDERIRRAKEFFTEFEADRLSFQFVPYGYQSRGVVRTLARRIDQLALPGRTQMMFHELWIGAEAGASWKDRLLGSVQKYFICQLFQRLEPALVHTSNAAYAARLQAAGIGAKTLGLFGAIPIATGSGGPWLLDSLAKAGVPITAENRPAFWLLGIFGSLYPVWPPEPLFRYLQAAAKQAGKRAVIVSVGRIGPGQDLWERLAQTYSDSFHFVRLGEQPRERVSEFFNGIDFGIGTTPFEIIGKSASVAAMLEHGLPVIVNRDDVKYKVPAAPIDRPDPLLIKMDGELPSVLETVRRRPPRSLLPDVAAQFLLELKALAGEPGA